MYAALNVRPYFVSRPLHDSYWFLAVGYFNVVLPNFISGSCDAEKTFWLRARAAKEQSARAAKNRMVVSRIREMTVKRGRQARGWAREDDEKERGTWVPPPPPPVQASPATPKLPSTALIGLSLLGNLDGIYKHASFPDIELHTLTTGSRQRHGGMLFFGYTFAGKLWPTPGAPAYALPPVHQSAQVPVHRPAPNVTDDYERWYTEPTPSNRMLLSMKSGIHSEIAWALDRLCRLCHNEQFTFRAIPGVIDVLYEWPEWYAQQAKNNTDQFSALFSMSPVEVRKRRHALESLFVMRNGAVNEINAQDLAEHKRTRPLILSALHNVKPDSDANSEYLLNIIEILQYIAPDFVLPAPSAPPETNPLPPLLDIVGHSQNRSLIIAVLTTIHLLLSNPANSAHLTADSPALAASIRYLPLLADRLLVDASLSYLYTHLSHPPMAKAFLRHPDMASTLKLLATQIISEQIEDTVSVEIGGPVYTAPAVTVTIRNHELTEEELSKLVGMPEPERCYEWMKTMFVADPKGELTQVDFWNLYKDVFVPFQDRYHLLVASDVIKNVTVVFPQAQAMVLPGPPQRFVVRGVDRRKEDTAKERFKCHWDRSQCSTPPFSSAGELYDHVLEHIKSIEDAEKECLWATCLRTPLPKANLRAHVLTHLPSAQPSAKHPSQSDTITLPSEAYPYPNPDPTTRPPPPPPKTTLTYRKPVVDPPSSSLTALLCIRVLFRTACYQPLSLPRIIQARKTS
ncbi:hypothetical protein EWM64_g7380 [Hericium alpestre]|uniref:RFX-type winged-helix domain-containing protein n=1 Tax=Hericium alpestre TaxID=135208 RepID=A0A4Y9ZPD2_9AGAM|nr:hypothetical protein EWM64_g7380 [Hericium alpestre]